MNTKRLKFWLRFGYFLVGFAFAFFLILFLVDKNPFRDLRMSFIKIGILATVSSLLYIIFFKSDWEISD